MGERKRRYAVAGTDKDISKLGAANVTLNQAPSRGESITRVWAWLITDDKGNEGIAVATKDGRRLPLIATEPKQFALFSHLAQQIANQMGVKVQLVQFGKRREGGTLIPQSKESQEAAEQRLGPVDDEPQVEQVESAPLQGHV